MIRPEDFIGRPYEEARAAFRWAVPHPYNIALDVCDRWADVDPERPAILYESSEGESATWTYGQLRREANRLANALAALGVGRGDRVAVILHQRVETAVSHLACYRMGAVAVPLTRMFGPDALAYRLDHSGCTVAIADPMVLPALSEVRDRLPALRTVIVADGGRAVELPEGDGATRPRHLRWSRLLAEASERFTPVVTSPDDPALIIYTSGTTGPPKGALHGHRVLLGHLPSVQLYFDFVPQGGEVYWTPADWAWIGGAYDLLFPGLRLGGPVVAFETTRFDPERAVALMARYRVTHVFLPPTALKMAMPVVRPGAPLVRALALRAVMSGGEPVSPAILEWAAETLPGVPLHEIYGQTEANLVCGNCVRLFPVRPGSMGRPFPGHEVTVLREDGTPAAVGEPGEVAVRADGDPVVFLGYWRNPEATREKVRDGWLRTGDVARRDAEGYFTFEGRTDDLITSGAYRIGPAEVEASLLTHPAVAEAAVVGAPDAVRGQVVTAFVTLRPGYTPSPALAAEIQAHVKRRLAAYAYPRRVEFLEAMPMTTTGKIRRAELRALVAGQGRSSGTPSKTVR
ncbi:MAG: AMP-binding protein [Armatimonadota bacterium]|nr:AMP-binding protein [Armatimonadota bacterium]MDR7448615.1 AMP-binding protein [Armatimonadota bacterium]MDR7459401.1 AMP-binding protein [Armatimonadota bacterium]MDR7478550.1 AMP-binding protein [Armatimonadota bacterium]MDR7487721.1 AMP-binding protein [Armatimonadota bacterium]